MHVLGVPEQNGEGGGENFFKNNGQNYSKSNENNNFIYLRYSMNSRHKKYQKNYTRATDHQSTRKQ